jgi:hypothetical protein
LVSQRIDGDMRKLRFNFLRDVIHECEHCGSMRALGIVERFTVGTFTRAIPVVLRDADDAHAR